jgi:predicted O-linked N-acetylglucosamine transferase (SPINDLY family)
VTPDAQAAIASAISCALVHHQAGRLPQAAAIYHEVLATDPNQFDALHLLGVIALQEGRSLEAIDLIRSALSQNPRAHTAHSNIGRAWMSQGDPLRASECFLNAIELNPQDLVARQNLAIAYHAMGRRDQALQQFATVAELDPTSPEAHNNLASILKETGNLDEAICHYDTALRLNPEFAEAHLNRARAYETAGRSGEALKGYQEAILLKPGLAEAHYCLGVMLQAHGMLDDAVTCFESALTGNPEYVEARWALAMARLTLVFDAGENPADFRRDFSQALDELDNWFRGKRVDEGFRAVGSQGPFYLAYREENNRALLGRYGDICVRLMRPWSDKHAMSEPPPHHAVDKINIGFVSAYFRDHSVWQAILKGWIRHLDKDRFALHVFHTGKVTDVETSFAKEHASRFTEASTGLARLTKEIAARNLDVVVYPELGMDAMSMKLASMRLAPIQMVAWGHPETSGLSTIDYYISAIGFEPKGAESNYTEQLLALPHLGCCYQRLQVTPANFEPSEFGIDAGAPLFVCPGTPFKYSPERDWIFVEIARRLGRCQFLFFLYDQENLSEKLMSRLDAAFGEAGMYADEFVTFLPWQSRTQFYGLLRRADVLLDTLGFSGFNTTMQAIECELPVVARDGQFMRGRFAAAILRRIGLDAWIAGSDEAYIALAVELAGSPQARKGVRDQMRTNAEILFDDIAPVRALEDFLVSKVRPKTP